MVVKPNELARLFELPLIGALLLSNFKWLNEEQLSSGGEKFQGLVFDVLSLFHCSLVTPDHLASIPYLDTQSLSTSSTFH